MNLKNFPVANILPCDSQVLPNIDVSYLDKELLDEKERLVIKDASFYKNIPQMHLQLWGHHNGIYCFTTTELIDWLKQHVGEDKTIEIGAGNSSIGRALNIPSTDSRLMERADVKATYLISGQPITKYPDDVIKLDANPAVDKYKPDVVIGAWVTHIYDKFEHWRGGNMYGIDEKDIIKKVNKYIVIGNNKFHHKKRIINRVSKTFKFDWLYSRAKYPEENMIYVWEN